ncbi:MAG TPA: tetratricopeptide repeat protein [Verrucomicrobiae bacterium]
MSRPRLTTLLLAFLTLVVFLPAVRFGFLNYDDNDYVTANPFVLHGLNWTDIQWAFTTFHAGNWHPLTWLSHMMDCTLFGQNPGAHHFVNVIFHAANVALLFTLLLRLTEKIWPAALVAALFGWHPLHVESVAWISERKDVLSTFFGLLALLSYGKFVELSKGQRPNAKTHFGLSLLFFALGLLAKPMLVTLPFVMLLLDFWPLKRVANCRLKVAGSVTDGWQPSTSNLQLVTEKWPFFALTLASCLVTFFAQRHGEAVVALAKVSLRYRLENAPVAVTDYLRNFFWPVSLSAIYPMPDKISPAAVAFSVAVLILISAAAWHWRKSKPYFLIGWLWFLGTLVPVIGLVQVGGQAMADRYTYIPSIGLFIAAVFLARDFVLQTQMPKIIAVGITALVLLACVLATEFQLQFWRDSETLFRRAIAVTQNNDIALVNLGVALEEQNRFAEALVVYQQAEKLESGRYQLHNDLGSVLAQLGRPAESLAEYREAIRLRPASAILHNAAGSELAELGQFDDALKEFSEAERLDPHFAAPHVETAKVFFKQGRDTEAVDELRAALRIEPDSFQTLVTAAHYLAANKNAAARDGRAALVLAYKANELSGHSQPLAFDVLGMANAAIGDFTSAVTCAQNALDLANAAQMKNLEQIRQRLELYKNHQPWLESFRATNAPVKN